MFVWLSTYNNNYSKYWCYDTGHVVTNSNGRKLITNICGDFHSYGNISLTNSIGTSNNGTEHFSNKHPEIYDITAMG